MNTPPQPKPTMLFDVISLMDWAAVELGLDKQERRKLWQDTWPEAQNDSLGYVPEYNPEFPPDDENDDSFRFAKLMWDTYGEDVCDQSYVHVWW